MAVGPVDRADVGPPRPPAPARHSFARRLRRHRPGRCGTYWYLQEGEVDVDPSVFVTAEGKLPPVLHVDSHAPLHADDGALITDEQWGVYFKQDKHGIQGGASPLPQGHEFQVDPYPTGSAEPGFPDLSCAALSHCMERFEGARPKYNDVRSGGVGAFTADNFPVFDYMRPNVFVVAELKPRLQDDCRGPRGGERRARRALEPAAPVPLRALRDGRPPPGLAQPLSLELNDRSTQACALGETGRRKDVVQFAILGSLELRDGDVAVALGGVRERSLLALLLLNANELVSTDRIVDELWGDRPPKAAVKTVQVYVSRLRKILGADAIVTRPPGYCCTSTTSSSTCGASSDWPQRDGGR